MVTNGKPALYHFEQKCVETARAPHRVLRVPRGGSGSYHVSVHHEYRDLAVGGPLDLLPHDRVDLHHLVGQALVVQEGSHLAAERTRLVLVQGQLRTLTTLEERQGYYTGIVVCVRFVVDLSLQVVASQAACGGECV